MSMETRVPHLFTGVRWGTVEGRKATWHGCHRHAQAFDMKRRGRWKVYTTAYHRCYRAPGSMWRWRLAASASLCIRRIQQLSEQVVRWIQLHMDSSSSLARFIDSRIHHMDSSRNLPRFWDNRIHHMDSSSISLSVQGTSLPAVVSHPPLVLLHHRSSHCCMERWHHAPVELSHSSSSFFFSFMIWRIMVILISKEQLWCGWWDIILMTTAWELHQLNWWVEFWHIYQNSLSWAFPS